MRAKQRSATLSRDDGYTMIELLVAGAALIGLLAVMGIGLTVVARTQVRVADRSAQIQQGRAMIERVTREVREGSGVQNATSSGVSFLTYVRRDQCGGSEPPASESTPAIQCRVTYACTAGACTRTEALPDGTSASSPVRVVDGLRSNSVFTHQPTGNPGHITVTLEYPSDDDEESVTLSDGASLRN